MSHLVLSLVLDQLIVSGSAPPYLVPIHRAGFGYFSLKVSIGTRGHVPEIFNFAAQSKCVYDACWKGGRDGQRERIATAGVVVNRPTTVVTEVKFDHDAWRSRGAELAAGARAAN